MRYSATIALISNFLTAPLELIKVRAQLIQEGRKLHGWGWERGVPTVRMFTEIIESGAGLRGLWTGYNILINKKAMKLYLQEVYGMEHLDHIFGVYHIIILIKIQEVN
jgi:hypothetical protein